MNYLSMYFTVMFIDAISIFVLWLAAGGIGYVAEETLKDAKFTGCEFVKVLLTLISFILRIPLIIAAALFAFGTLAGIFAIVGIIALAFVALVGALISSIL